MTEIFWEESPTRPRRAAAKNALYRSCPTCDRKFLISELEFHVNLCLQKLDKQKDRKLIQRKSNSPTKQQKPKSPPPQSSPFKVDKKVI